MIEHLKEQLREGRVSPAGLTVGGAALGGGEGTATAEHEAAAQTAATAKKQRAMSAGAEPECWCSVCFLLFIQSKTLAQGIKVGLSTPLNLSRSILIDKPRYVSIVILNQIKLTTEDQSSY